MKHYFADTNIFLRLLLGDNKDQQDKAKFYLQMASDGKIQIELINETIFEIEFLLRKQYKIDRKIVARWLEGIITTNYLIIRERLTWLDILILYGKVNVDMPDLYLFTRSILGGAEILTFDKDFEKLKKLV